MTTTRSRFSSPMSRQHQFHTHQASTRARKVANMVTPNLYIEQFENPLRRSTTHTNGRVTSPTKSEARSVFTDATPVARNGLVSRVRFRQSSHHYSAESNPITRLANPTAHNAVDAMVRQGSSNSQSKMDLCPICSLPLLHQDVLAAPAAKKVILCQSSSSLRTLPLPTNSSMAGTSAADDDFTLYDFDTRGPLKRTDVLPNKDYGSCSFMLPLQTLLDEFVGLCEQRKPSKSGLEPASSQEFRMIPPYCNHCRAYIVLESSSDHEQELMLSNLASWLVACSCSEDDQSQNSKDTEKPNQGKITLILDNKARANELSVFDGDSHSTGTKSSSLEARDAPNETRQLVPLDWDKVMNPATLGSPSAADNHLPIEVKRSGSGVPSRATSPRSTHRRQLMEEDELAPKRTTSTDIEKQGFSTDLVNVSPHSSVHGSPIHKERIALSSPSQNLKEKWLFETEVTYSVDDDDASIEVESLKVEEERPPKLTGTTSSPRKTMGTIQRRIDEAVRPMIMRKETFDTTDEVDNINGRYQEKYVKGILKLGVLSNLTLAMQKTDSHKSYRENVDARVHSHTKAVRQV